MRKEEEYKKELNNFKGEHGYVEIKKKRQKQVKKYREEEIKNMQKDRKI